MKHGYYAVSELALLMVACFCTPVPGAQPATAPAPIAFDDAPSVTAWSFHNGPEFPGATGGIAWDSADGNRQAGSLALRFSFAGGGNYVQASRPVPRELDPRAVRVWLKKRGGHRITFRVTDAGGQSFQKGIDYAADDWQQIEVGLGAWANSWGGAGDGKVRFPIRQFGILIENSDAAKEGVLLADDLEWLADEGGAGEQSAWYDLAREPWRAGGFEGGTWRYGFGASEPSLHGHFSLLGRPRRLRLIIDSEAGGHILRAEIGSHFQVFFRDLATLRQGEQTIEVPLGDMSTWKHRGGPDDGQVRSPLRMLRLHLARGDGPESGRLTFRRMEVETSFAPDASVVLIPSVEQKDETAVFGVMARNLRTTEASGRLLCEIRGVGGVVAQKSAEVTLPGSGAGVLKTFEAPLEGRHMLDATFRWMEPGAGAVPAYIGLSTAPEGEGSKELDPRSLVGAGLYLYRWNGHPQARENMDRMAALARRAGVKWSREEIQWHTTEPEEGRFAWDFYDQMLESARSNGISVYGLLAYWSSWAKVNTPEGVEQYCRWARQVVRRYKDRIKHWEIWNEPNIFFWSGPRELYAKLLTEAYAAIKAEDPEAVVMGCSTAGIDHAFIRNVMAWGGRFDALTIHPYRGVLDDLPYMQELRDVRQLVEGRPVWITEIGFPSQQIDGYSERNQASLVARVYLASIASGAVENVSWYDFRNDGEDPFYNEFNFGLVRSDFRLKPGYRALATLGRALASAKVVGPVEVGADAYAFRFTDGSTDTIVACAPSRPRVLTFKAQEGLRITNGMGELMQAGVVDGRQTITLDAGFPVYIAGPAGFAFESVEPVVSLTSDSYNPRPGARLALRFPFNVEITRWEVPSGWKQPVKVDEGLYMLRVPAEAQRGSVTIQAFIELGSNVRVPLGLRVQPALLRL